ncbi:hydroxyproline O-galactosyltransferase HPGT1 isoform X1 [Rhododendron vialii]|uniref:hydroxyproline O-galactosyltransferase HPGT1 isoform X1 n=1 Tax=Rhododendron vialii TaxID=182163 RepID=UPI00265EC737|nr:hydroxyproline O-galactosyltransferase HPGT1 isoform X1 [Rhododendron vialii]
MQSKGSSSRLSGTTYTSRISTLMLSMLATIASFYVAGRLWQDAENRVYIIKELDRITGQGQSAVSVDDTLKIIACREQQKKLSALEMELAAARPEGFKSNHLAVTNQPPKKRPLVVIGVLTGFSRKTNRDAIRKAWMGTGSALQKMEDRKGIIVRFVIGRSSNRGDSLERAIDSENKQTNDFSILENHIEALEELPKKTKNFFAQASEKWDAEFFAKVNDDVYVNIDALGSTLAAHLDKPRTYIGCMKSGEVFSEQSHKWYEPDWWKFGNKKSYFRHASGEMFVISQALAKFVSINRSILRTYAHDDVSVGSWFIGLDVKHVDEKTFCCSSSSWSSGAVCAGV